MDSEQIEQLLKEADRRPMGEECDPTLMADRVLKTIRHRRATRAVTTLLLLAGVIGVTIMNLPHPTPAPEIALVPKPPLERRVEDELAAIQAEIAMREASVRRLEAIERRSQLAARLASLPVEPRENQLVERAAAAVVYQADRMMQSGTDSLPALQAYHEVIAYFPQAQSAQTARQRVAQLDKAG